jgi:hypothetical protein
MRLFALLLIALGLVWRCSAKVKDDWDELEKLLKNIDNIDKNAVKEEEFVADQPADDDDDDEDPLERDRSVKREDDEEKDPKKKKNPCEFHRCGWGKECILDKKGQPSCECIKECPEIEDPEPFDKVCSSQNETFESLCHLYQQRCFCKRGLKQCDDTKFKRVHLEYLGACKELDKCTDDLMEQFPTRMADWLFQVMRDLKKRKELNNEDWLNMLEEAEIDDAVKHVYPVIWKFCDLDKKPHDRHVTHHELIPITAPVIPMESCIKPFLHKCDADDDKKITLKEWGKCLGLKEGEIVERC